MEKRLSKNERLDMILKNVFGDNKSAMARALEVEKTTMSNRIQLGTWYDAVALKEAIPELDSDWLLTGEGEMLKTETHKQEPKVVKVDETKNLLKGIIRETMVEMMTQPTMAHPSMAAMPGEDNEADVYAVNGGN